MAQTWALLYCHDLYHRRKSYRNDPEETDLSSGDFYDMLRGGAMSTTSQINVETFREVAGKMARDGFDVLYVGFSSGLSGTFNSARIAFEDLSAEYPEHKFLAVDSLCASMGEGLLVYHAAQQQKAGRSIEETARWLEENKLPSGPLVHGGRPESSQARRACVRCGWRFSARCSTSSRCCTWMTRVI